MPSAGHREKADKILAKRHDDTSQIKYTDKETCGAGKRMRQMGFYLDCLKFLLLTFRILLPVFALAELVGAIIVLVHLFPHRGLFHEPILGPGIALTCLAVAIALSSYFVGKATTERSQCLLLMLVVLMVLMSLLHLADVIWALVLKSSINPPTLTMLDSIRNGTNAFECCGAVGLSDHFVRNTKSFPTSCCVPAKKSEGHCNLTYQRGCAEPVAEEVRKALGWAAVDGIAGFMIVVMVALLAFYFRRQVRRFETPDEPDASDGLMTT